MKTLAYLLAIFLMAAMVISPAYASGPAPTQDDDPPPAQPSAQAAAPHSLYLPVARVPGKTYQVSGQIKDANDTPLGGVTVTSDTGAKTVTDANGVYNLSMVQGERQITASIAGKLFDPQPAWVNLTKDMHNINFSAGAGCITPVPNASFETYKYYWNPVGGGAGGSSYGVPYYTNAIPGHTGSWSGFTGLNTTQVNLETFSRWRSHEFYIPADATNATVSLYYYPTSTEIAAARQPEAGAAPEITDMTGMNTDATSYPNLADGQYLLVTDPYNNVLATLMYQSSNAQAWTSSGELSLLPYRGRWVKLEFGTYNNGLSGVTSAYFDDVLVSVCRGNPLVTCTNPTNLLVNSTFESAGGGWQISTAKLPSVYDTSGLFAYSPSSSMQSGIPLGTTPPYNYETTSEFYQYVTIPVTATRVTLSARMLPRTSDGWGYHILEQQQMDEEVARGLAPTAQESQYAYICANGACGPNPTTLRQLIRWFPVDSYNWQYRAWDISEFRGQTIGVLFGAQNDGDSGNTVLYVDDVYLQVCP